MTNTAATTISGLVAGTWTIDPVHSEVGFMVRHMMVSKVRGKFNSFSGEIVTGDKLSDASASATVELSSIDTNNAQRDEHLRSVDFFEVDSHQTMTYRSTGVRADGEDFIVDGELTIKGVTKEVPLHVEFGGVGPDAYGGTRAGFSATGEINRKDFGVSFGGVSDTGIVIVGDKITLHLEVEAILNT
jgi:polyisoprenoid-binding protein YceI